MIKPPQEQTTEEWVEDFDAGNVTRIKTRQEAKPKSGDFPKTQDEDSLQDDLPLIEPGKYLGKYIRDELHRGLFGGETCKLCIKFEVSGTGILRPVLLEAWFKVDETKNGFSCSKRSHYAHQFFSIFPDSTETRMDRLYPSKLKGIDLEVEVATVAEDSKRNPKPKALHYSKIERIIGRKK